MMVNVGDVVRVAAGSLIHTPHPTRGPSYVSQRAQCVCVTRVVQDEVSWKGSAKYTSTTHKKNIAAIVKRKVVIL